MKRRRNPRRRIVSVRTECIPCGQAMISVDYCVLACGHEVEGYPDTLDGRKACPECGRDRMRKVVQVHSTRTHRKEDGKMRIDFHIMSRLECGHDVNGYGPLELVCPECGKNQDETDRNNSEH